MNSLKKELETYARHKDELLGTAKGKYVLIKDDQILGTFESQADAVSSGYEKLGPVSFLVKQVLDIELPANFTSFKLAV